MINYIRHHLSVKLFLTYILVVLVALIILVVMTQFTLPTVFNHRMMRMGGGLNSENAFSHLITGMQGSGQGQEVVSEFYNNFRDSFNEALTWAGLVAIGIALVISFLFSRGLIAPLRAMKTVSHRIAEGRYEERVSIRNVDEFSELAVSMNQMAEKLQRIEEMRRQLIGDIAHELRTPLTAIRGSMEGLIDGVLPVTQETFQQVEGEAVRLARLVDDLQELSRVEAGAFSMDVQPVDVISLVETSRKRFAQQYKKKKLLLTTALDPNLPPVFADADRIGQVLLNLLDNALRYTPTGGIVRVEADRRGEHVHIAVIDDGIGISADHLPHIFTRFYRVDKSRSRRAGGGSGVGLTIARHFVEAHGGEMWAESEGEGKGSRFVFTLPVANRNQRS